MRKVSNTGTTNDYTSTQGVKASTTEQCMEYMI